MTIVADVPKFTSDYAILDVLKGRKALERYFKKGGGPVRAVLTVEIDRPSGSDDVLNVLVWD